MFFDILAVLILTFLSSIGLITVSDWLMDKAFSNKIAAKSFLVIDISSVKESEVEGSVRSFICREEFFPRLVYLDCRSSSDESAEICKKLENRFGCKVIKSGNELSDFILQSLHTDIKSI